MFRADRFQRFDYGGKRNLEIYGTPTPPDYDLSTVYKKILLIVGQNDLMGSVADSKKLENELVNSLVETYYIKGGHLCAMINRDTEFLHRLFLFIKTY